MGWCDWTASEERLAGSVTNRIQKEIVKQLLYRESPEHVPGCRYHRLTGFNWLRGTGLQAGDDVPAVLRARRGRAPRPGS